MMRAFAVLALVLTAAADLRAQTRVESVLRPGVRIRYAVPHASRPFTGVLEDVDTTRLVVRPDGINQSITLGLDSLHSLAVSHGVRASGDGAKRGARTGLLMGLGLGALVTTIVWLSAADERCDGCMPSATISAAQVSVVATLAFTILGAALGAAAPGEKWDSISLRTLRRGPR